MWRNCKGTSLLEVTFSFALLITVIAVTTPIIDTVMAERKTIQEQLQAYEMIENALVEWVHGSGHAANDVTVEKDGTSYFLTTTFLSPNTLQVCVEWQGRNGRHYYECGTAKGQ